MYEKQVEITAESGFTDPALSQFVSSAKTFEANITCSANGKTSSATSLFKLGLLGLIKGQVLNISAEGPQAQEAVDHLVDLVVQLQ